MKNLQEMIDRLAQIPLLLSARHKAGATAMSMDIQGYIVEKLSGQSLPDFMREHIFAPLGMKDAGFYVPADKRARFAAGYHEVNGELVGRADRQRRAHRLCHPADRALGRRRPGFDGRGLLPLRADAPERRRAGRHAHSRARRPSS